MDKGLCFITGDGELLLVTLLLSPREAAQSGQKMDKENPGVQALLMLKQGLAMGLLELVRSHF